METKDKLTLGIAVLAFLVSAVSTAITIVRGRREKQRAIRNDITNVLSQIVENSLENARLFNESQGQSPFYQRASAILNQRNTFLLHQGVYLSEQLPELVTAVEYNTLAVAHADSGDLLRAESYYEKAIVASRDDYYRSIATRSLAVFLFQQHRLAEARRNLSLLLGCY
jgi:tetratricopeptide (TPR) repeat protein